MNLQHQTTIALVGKYVELKDAYISVNEALKHAGYAFDCDVQVIRYRAEDITAENVQDKLGKADGIIVPGGFGSRGLEGMIQTVKYARENDVPYLGVCLGMQMACLEFARNVAGIKDATSTEINPQAKHRVIDLMADQHDVENRGGTLRLGAWPCKIQPHTLVAQIYNNQSVIQERHRHRYEFNNEYRSLLAQKGLVFSGVSPDNRLVEIIEIPTNRFFVGVQFHPEFLSRPARPEPIFKQFVGAACQLTESDI